MKIYTVQSLISQPGPKQAYTFELKLDQRLLIIKSHKLVSIYEKFQWQLFFEGYAYVDSQCQTVAALHPSNENILRVPVFLLVDDSLADLLNQGMNLCHGCLSYLGDEHIHVLLVLLVHQFSTRILLVELWILIVPLIASEYQDFITQTDKHIYRTCICSDTAIFLSFVLSTCCRLAHAKEVTKFQYFSMHIKMVFLMKHATIIKPKIKVRTIISSSTASSVDRDQVRWLCHCLHKALCYITLWLDSNPRYRQMNKTWSILTVYFVMVA